MDRFGLEIENAPSDGISCLKFGLDSVHLLCSSWDGSVRLYDTVANSLKGVHNNRGAALDCCFGHDTSTGFMGGLERLVKKYDFSASVERVMGEHSDAVKCIDFHHETGLVVSGSWDRTVKGWDSRTPSCVFTAPQPDKVFSMSVSSNKLVTALNGRHVLIYDIRKMDAPEFSRQSSLKYQTRCVRIYPDESGYALSSIEGRVAIEYFDPSPDAQSQKYVFKCHRSQSEGNDIIYPVNVIAFHPTVHTFATGGCDGYIYVWDRLSKKRVSKFGPYPTSVASVSFSPDGSRMAVASSYTYEGGDKPHPKDQIFVRHITDADVKKK
eukprot:GILI01034188.1.p1 GENE.GILI01034188.1~~GILI01034188.1.p1  ORF type:complete len:333 (+),score=71.51 GILI01034188.1:29-1000(+)